MIKESIPALVGGARILRTAFCAWAVTVGRHEIGLPPEGQLKQMNWSQSMHIHEGLFPLILYMYYII